MNLVANQIKQLLPMRRVAEYYGFPPGRSGFIQCPFHPGDHTASLKLYERDGGWHCFGCGRGGSVIDFVMELNHCGFEVACQELDGTFQLGLFRSNSFKERRKLQTDAALRRMQSQRREKQQAYSDTQYQILAGYRRWLSSQRETDAVLFDLAHLDRLLDRFLDRNAILTFDAAARVNALLSKHPNRGEYDLHGGEY